MRVYKGSFRKKNGKIRNMLFSELKDMPVSFLEQYPPSESIYPEGMELVWDQEKDNFRVFNYNSVISKPTLMKVN